MGEDEAAQANSGTLARFSLAGKRALVTGASRGIGRVIALALAEAGADIAVSARDATKLDGVVEEICGLGRLAEPIVADLAERGASRTVVATAWERLGPLDVVVASAGISPIWKRGHDITEEEWDDIFALNARATFFLCAEAGRRMAEGVGGSIITVASVTALSGAPRMAAYSASKAAIIQFTRTLAVELAERRVRVNALAPGYIETDMTRDLLQHPYWGPVIRSGIPFGRAGQPEDVSALALYLASPASSYVTGQIFVIDGGMVVG
jgi:NAD(P)-dependent dehydrogenase (short-subunit alcohol dehydrogenase family)